MHLCCARIALKATGDNVQAERAKRGPIER
jgi:hypothetical protein